MILLSLIGLILVTVLSIIDIKTHLLPDFVTLPGSLFILMYRGLVLHDSFKFLLLEWTIAVLYFSLIRFAVKGKLGWGDVKYAGLLALLVGFPSFFWLITASALSALIFVGAKMLLKQFHKGERIAFGPFLSIGYISERILYFIHNGF